MSDPKVDPVDPKADLPQDPEETPDGMPEAVKVSPPTGPDDETGEAETTTIEPSE